MDLNEYQNRALKTAIYPSEMGLVYTVLGLVGESGEVAEKIKKMIRDGRPTAEAYPEIIRELGDVLWYVAVIAKEMGVALDTVATDNLKKLEDRRNRNALQGEGDER